MKIEIVFLYYNLLTLNLCEPTLILKPNIKTGKCLNSSYADAVTQFVDSAGTCFYWCIEGRQDSPSCIAWSYLHNWCTISFSFVFKLISNSECVYYNRLEELNIVAYWRMNNQNKGNNYGTHGSALNAIEMGPPLSFTSDASVFSGSSQGNEGYNISTVKTVTFTEMTFFAWIRSTTFTTMPVFESVPFGHGAFFTHLWLWPNEKQLSLVAHYTNTVSKGSRSGDVLSSGYWNFVTTVITMDTRQHYYNETLVNETFVTSYTLNDLGSGGGQINLSDEVYLGTTKLVRSGHNYNFIGEMKCAGFAARALSGEEVKELMRHCAL